MAQLLERSSQRIEALINDPGVQHPQLARNYYYDYKRLVELIQAVEEGPVLALGHYSDKDRLATKIVHQICAEIRYPYALPLCSAISAQYYWSLVSMDLIFVPCSEPFHLLGLADLYHELAHFILFREEKTLLLPFHAAIDQQFDQMVKEAQQKNWSNPSIARIEAHRHLWKRNWFLEFASDMVAAYCAGPAYGSSNVRLCMNLSADLFSGTDSHPADDARTTAIDLILRHLVCDAAASNIAAKWQELIALSGQVRPQEFAIAYPTQLLVRLAEFLFTRCEQMELVAWTRQGSGGSFHVTKLLNDAWQEFEARPESFSAFERAQVEALKSDLGL